MGTFGTFAQRHWPAGLLIVLPKSVVRHQPVT